MLEAVAQSWDSRTEEIEDVYHEVTKNREEETGNKLQGSDIRNGIEETGNKLLLVRSR